MPEDNTVNIDEKVEVHERLARIETAVAYIKEMIEAQNDADCAIDKKIDKILENDKDKLQRIAKNETSIKYMKAAMYVFASGIITVAVKLIVG